MEVQIGQAYKKECAVCTVAQVRKDSRYARSGSEQHEL